MDSVGGMLNPIGKMPKTHYKKEFCNGFTGKKLIVYNGILNGNHWNFCYGFYWASIVFFSRDLTSFFSTGQTVFQLF